MRRGLLTALYIVTLAGIALAAWRGRDYYALSLVERPRHPLHWELKPGGELGHWFGAGGLGAMIAMLSYSVRKRVPLLRRAGRLGTWLDVHIFLGITGPLLIVLHSAFKVGGLIAISFWSMVAVATSGILGRFLYAQIPRGAAGDQLTLDEARRLDLELTGRLRREFGISDADLARLDAEEDGGRQVRSLLAELAGLLVAPIAARRRFARFRRHAPRLPRLVAARLGRAVRQRALLHQRLRLWRRVHELFHYWHVFHKPFAVLMYLFAALHVVVAWATGYGFGGR
ncbi:MAG: hypothetical protein F9K18_09505 [Thermoanaerobaculia bacterium]|nr:MAG: hypothetical protein F9K18_09505 [Thermoanaerobaculia bacterium]